jgi:1L-myo-inositol 1-phosphate cytidylyltransferase
MTAESTRNGGRTGIILAAGLGARLGNGGGRSRPQTPLSKPLIRVCDTPLLLRVLRSLEVAGCARAVIVLGHAAEAVREAVSANYRGSLELVFTVNERYTLKNGVSVLCARPYAGSEFLVTMADHVLDDAILRKVKGHCPPRSGATLCVDYKLDEVFDLDDATKVREEGGRIREIGKSLATYNCIDTGVFVCTPALLDALEEVLAETGDASLSEGVSRLAMTGRMTVLDIGDAFWQDVDTPEMLAHAEAVLARRSRG